MVSDTIRYGAANGVTRFGGLRHRADVNELSLEEAYEKWSPDLVGYAAMLVGPSEAADVVADTFVSLFAAGDVRWVDVREPRGYLFRCVLNSSRMHARSASRRTGREDASTRGVRGPSGSDHLLANPEIAAAVRSLSIQQRAVIYHTYWDDLSVPATADLLGISVGSVKRQLARARARLRKVLR